MLEWKIVVLGGGGVGKSAFTIQYIHNRFVDRYDPTIEDLYRKTVELDGKQYMVEILDTAGQETFMSMRDLYLRSGHAFLLVYSITSSTSLQEISTLPSQIRVLKETDKCPIVVVGNKSDLEGERKVPTSQGESWAKSVSCTFFESSAKNRVNVDEVFLKIIKLLDQIHTGDRPKKKKGGCVLV
ncbi:small G-protein [Planoprotostelium fungivorum]|uniref:small monomeric GTPase n=1 Tax=Planoprotostelium fungivorum TaxID=1890364 RepID=A0A2P6NC61_9EUKA|nr:small G-protein [Planoprotostelium fungivorum]